MKTLIMILCVVLLTIFVVSSYYAARYVNYNLSYKSMVQETVRDMVRQDCLKGGDIDERS